MIATALFRDPRLLILAIGVILVAGLSSFFVLSRMEDPILGKRVALVSTVFPGADAERVEMQVTVLLEKHLRGVPEIKEVQSTSRPGLSSIVIELRDSVVDVAPVWSRVRDELSDAAEGLPSGTRGPDLERIELKACATIIALTWNREGEPNYAILRRLAEDLKLATLAVAGTENAKLFGDPGEEVLVEVEPELLAQMGLTAGAVARQVEDSDAKHSAGVLRGGDARLSLSVDAEVDSLQRLGETVVQYGRGQTVNLSEIAAISKGAMQPPSGLALVDGVPAVGVGVYVRDDHRIDLWADRVDKVLREFRTSQLPRGIDLDVIFSQNKYVEGRLQGLIRSLFLSTIAVIFVIFLLMGWRSTLIVGTALPLSALMVLSGMRLLGIPIHQMSVTGLIIALGLLIDNAIVIVDEVRSRIWAGLSPVEAISKGVKHLAMPLFGSTLTTTLAFAPIAMLPGPPGEFVGSIAISVILAINASFLLAMTVAPAMTALLEGATGRRTLLRYGFSNDALRRAYDWSLQRILASPWVGVAIGALLPILGFIQAQQLPEQFFPAADRDQIQIEIELGSLAPIEETRATAEALRRFVIRDADVKRVHWFLGESAPTFFYNVVPRRRNTPSYAQALVELKPGAQPRDVIRRLQIDLDSRFAQCRVLVRQLEQGPPFDAPVEVRLWGPDLATLQQLGSKVRVLLSESAKVVHTRSDMEEALPKLVLQVDEQQARLAGLNHREIARQIYSTFEGVVAGSLLEGSVALPIRVRVSNQRRASLDELGSLQLRPAPRPGPPTRGANSGAIDRQPSGPPVAALARLELSSEAAAVTRVNGERVNEVKAYITAGTLPSNVVAEFEDRLRNSDFKLPSGYRLSMGGEALKRNQAVGDLLANAALLVAVIIVTLVVSFRSFRMSLIIISVGGLSIGLGPGALWWFGYPFGFMAIVGTMGLVGVAINDAIVVLAGIRENPEARAGDPQAIRTVVVGCTRHIVATSLTTMVGFTPLVLNGGGFWPPLAITIAGGVGGATVLALYFVPCLYLLLKWDRPNLFGLVQTDQ